MKESFVENVETSDPLDGPKLYLNIVHNERILPPLTKDRKIADANDDNQWHIIPLIFSDPVKRRNLTNVDCIHFDCHLSSVVVTKMRENETKFRNIWNHLIQRFQHQVKDQFLLHKKSIKLCKTKKYKSGARGDAKKPPKFVLPKALDKDTFSKERTRLE